MNIKLLIMAMVLVTCQVNAETTYIDYCGTNGVGSEYSVHVKSGVSVMPHQGQFLLVPSDSDLIPSPEYAKSKAILKSIPSECIEYAMLDGNVAARVYFDFNKSNLTRNSVNILNRVAQQEYNLDDALLIRGHADHIGTVEYNHELGMRRAESVSQYLQQRNIDFERISLESKGKLEPIATNSTAEGRALNRRVEIIK